MTAPTPKPARRTRTGALMWTGAAVVLALVIAIAFVAIATKNGASASSSDDYLRAGLNKPTADLLSRIR